QLISSKLNETNYLVWHQQTLAAIKGYGLYQYISPNQKIPEEILQEESSEPSQNPEYLLWIRQDQILASWLLSSLTEPILVTTVGLTTSKQIWDSLQISFASQSKAKIMQYKLKLQTIKKGGSNMRDFLNQVKSCCDILVASGQKVTEEEQIMYILAGLGHDYNPVMVSIMSKTEALSLREVQSLLLTFETRLEAMNLEQPQYSFDGSAPNVNLTEQSQGRGRGVFQTNRGRSHNGQRGGRFGRGRGRTGNRTVRCQVCFYSGHTADRCWHRFDQSFMPNNNTGSLGRGRNPSVNATNLISAPMNEGMEEASWYPDSGASNHVTYDLANLNLASEYQGSEKVQVGNGKSLQISHIGKSIISSNEHKSPQFVLNNLLFVPEITKNLMSVSQFSLDNHVYFEFHPHC
ncbi:Unknown protein, partial [Striga hermonthica]